MLGFEELNKTMKKQQQEEKRWFIVMYSNEKMTTFFKECETKKKGEQLVKELTETYRGLKTQNPEKYGSVVRFTVLNTKKNYDLYSKLSLYNSSREIGFIIGWGIRKILQNYMNMKKKQVETPGAE